MFDKRYVILLGGLAALIAGYVIYWFTAAGWVETAIVTWRAERAGSEITIDYQDLRVEGFPFRLKAILREPVLRFKAGNEDLVWRREELAVVLQPWNFRHYIADLAGRQRLERAGAPGRPLASISFTKALASLQLDENGRLELFSVQGEAASGEFPLFAHSFQADKVELHLRPNNRPEGGYDLAVNSQTVQNTERPDLPDWARELKRIDLDISLIRPIEPPLTRAKLMRWRDRNGSLVIRTAWVRTDTVKLGLKGALTLDPELRAAGRLEVEIHGHRYLIDDLVRRRRISPDIAANARVALGFLALAWGNKVVAPLVLKNGVATLGPLQLLRLTPLFPDAGQNR